MKIVRAVIAGVSGALAMSLAMFLLRVAGIPVNLEALLGSTVEPAGSANQWLAGFVMHLCVGAVAALVYAVVFEFAIQRAGVMVGAGIGLSHGLLAGLLMSGIPAMNPLEWGTQAAPGPFLQHLPFGPFIFVLLHILYGGTVGVVYGHPIQHEHTYTNQLKGVR